MSLAQEQGGPGLDPREAAPIFIVGMPRAGTTALIHALREGAGVPGWNEGHIFPLLDQLLTAGERYYEGLGPGVADHPGHAVSALPRERLEQALVQLFLEIHEDRLGGLQFLDKSPSPGMLDAAPRLAALFPRARFLLAWRRGIENVLSRLERFSRGSFEHHCRSWALAMKKLAAIRPELGDRALEIEQRDLALAPEETVGRVGAFLGLEDAEVEAAVRWLRENRPQQTREVQDERLIALEETGWSREQREVFEAECGPMMRVFGYGLGAAPPPPPGARIDLLAPGLLDGARYQEAHPKKAVWRRRRDVLLHPPPPGRAPTRLTFHRVPLRGRIRVEAEVKLEHPEAPRVEFVLLVHDSRSGELVLQGKRTLEAGETGAVRTQPGSLEGPHEVTLLTRLAPEEESRDHARAVWARVEVVRDP